LLLEPIQNISRPAARKGSAAFQGSSQAANEAHPAFQIGGEFANLYDNEREHIAKIIHVVERESRLKQLLKDTEREG